VKEQLLTIFARLDQWIESEASHPNVLIQVLGQCSLILNSTVRLPLAGTMDLDARVKPQSRQESVYFIQKKLADLLDQEGFELDPDVHLIWLPPESTFTVCYETPRMRCEILDPLFALCSKAVKAREKNRILIREALKEYGKPLRELIEKHGGHCDYFEA